MEDQLDESQRQWMFWIRKIILILKEGIMHGNSLFVVQFSTLGLEWSVITEYISFYAHHI